MVHFTEEIQEKETSTEMKKKDQQMDQKGTQVLFYAMRENILDDDKKIQEVLVTEIPKKFHKSPEVIEAKEAEMSNFIRFEAFEEVEDEGQPRISSQDDGQGGQSTKPLPHHNTTSLQGLSLWQNDKATMESETTTK